MSIEIRLNLFIKKLLVKEQPKEKRMVLVTDLICLIVRFGLWHGDVMWPLFGAKQRKRSATGYGDYCGVTNVEEIPCGATGRLMLDLICKGWWATASSYCAKLWIGCCVHAYMYIDSGSFGGHTFIENICKSWWILLRYLVSIKANRGHLEKRRKSKFLPRYQRRKTNQWINSNVQRWSWRENKN